MRELRRVLFHRATVFLLLLLTGTGAALFFLHVTESSVSKDYPAVFTECYHELLEEYESADPASVSREELEKRRIDAVRISSIAHHYRLFGEDETFFEMLSESTEYEEAYRNGLLQKYIDEPLRAEAEEEAFALLEEQFDYLSGFNSYYSYIKKNAERMQRTSLFGDPSSFAYRNTIKTVRDFAAIDGAKGSLGDDRAVTSLFDDPIADYLMLIFMAAVSVIMLKERRSGLWHLVRSTPRGRGRLASERMLTLFVCSFIATLFIFGSRMIISYTAYDGLRWSNRLVQSIPGFNGIPIPTKINTFLLIYCLVKVVCTFFAGLLLDFLLSSIKNLNLAIALSGILLAVEFTLYSTVRDSSILVPFKYVNIFQLISPKGFTVSYLNLNVFEQPVNTRAAVSAVMSCLALFSAVGLLLTGVLKRPVGRPNPLESLLDKLRRKAYRFTPLQETGKVVFAQRGIFVIAVLVWMFTSFCSLPRPSVTDEQRAVMSYYYRYAGSVSEETLASVDMDIEAVEEKLLNTTESFLAMSYRQTLSGLEYFRGEVSDIIEKNASGKYANEIKLLPPFTYMTVFGDRSRTFEVSQGLKALLGVALLTAGMYAYERQSGMTRLLRSLPSGRRRLFLKKELITLAFSALVFLAVYLPEILAEAKAEPYGGFAYFDYPMQGLPMLRNVTLPLSVGGLTVLFYFIRFLMIFLVGSAVGLISSLTERVNTALVAASAVFALPACVVAMGVDSIYGFTPLPLLWVSGAMFYKDSASFIIFFALLLCMTAANYMINCSPRTFKRNREAKRFGKETAQ